MSSTAAVRPGVKKAARAGAADCAPPPTCAQGVLFEQALSASTFIHCRHKSEAQDEHLEDRKAAAGCTSSVTCLKPAAKPVLGRAPA